MARSARKSAGTPTSSTPGPAKVRKPPLSRARRRGAARGADDTVAELDFEAGDERSGRIGDPLPDDVLQRELSPQRVREAGLTAAETVHPERNTADDLAPDTLLDDEGGASPADQRGPVAADAALSIVDASAIGAGGGLDEAEDAEADPLDPAEVKRIRKRVARSGASLAEPNESRAGNPGRERNRRG